MQVQITALETQVKNLQGTISEERDMRMRLKKKSGAEESKAEIARLKEEVTKQRRFVGTEKRRFEELMSQTQVFAQALADSHRFNATFTPFNPNLTPFPTLFGFTGPPGNAREGEGRSCCRLPP